MTVSSPVPPSKLDVFADGIAETSNSSLPRPAFTLAALAFKSKMSSKSVPEGVHVSVVAKLVVTCTLGIERSTLSKVLPL